MELTTVDRHILYALGNSYQSFNNRFSDKPLTVSMSKAVFIDVLLSLGAVSKKERALYKNFEDLEQKKLIKYEKDELRFTRKGFSMFKKIDAEVVSFVDLGKQLRYAKTVKLHKKLQSKLK